MPGGVAEQVGECQVTGEEGIPAGRVVHAPGQVGSGGGLSEVVDEVEREQARVVITEHGRPAAVVVSAADLESLEETLDITGNAALLADIKEAVTQTGAGAAVPLSKDEALRLTIRP